MSYTTFKHLQIEDLAYEAGCAGDRDLQFICERWLRCEASLWDVCVISEALGLSGPTTPENLLCDCCGDRLADRVVYAPYGVVGSVACSGCSTSPEEDECAALEEILQEARDQRASERALCGDAWAGADDDIARLAGRVKALRNEQDAR